MCTWYLYRKISMDASVVRRIVELYYCIAQLICFNSKYRGPMIPGTYKYRGPMNTIALLYKQVGEVQSLYYCKSLDQRKLLETVKLYRQRGLQATRVGPPPSSNPGLFACPRSVRYSEFRLSEVLMDDFSRIFLLLC